MLFIFYQIKGELESNSNSFYKILFKKYNLPRNIEVKDFKNTFEFLNMSTRKKEISLST